MTEAELRHALGDRVYDAFAPRGLLYQHDAEDPDQLAYLGQTSQGEDVEINKRAAESDLLVYVNINLVAMDGGWKSTAVGLASYRSLRHHHNPATMEASHSFMDQHHSELHHSTWRMGRVLVDSGVKVFQIETTLNTDTFPSPFDFLSKREWEWTARDRGLYVTTAKSLGRTPVKLARRILHSIEAPHQMTSIQCGEVEAVHQRTTDVVYRQQLVEVQGQTDVLTMGVPYICPYNVHSIMNPILVMCTALGYFFNLYRGKPLVREGGVVILTHPTLPDFDPVFHPSYIDFYEQVLADTTDPHVMSAKWEQQYAEDDWYRHLYRTSNAYHGVHPFYMWYWGAHALRHCGKVIVVGGARASRAPARVRAGVDARRRPRDGRRRRRALPDDHPRQDAAAAHRGRQVMGGSRPVALGRPSHRRGGGHRRSPRPAVAQRRLPLPPTHHPSGRGGAGRATVARRRLRHPLGPHSPRSRRPWRAVVGTAPARRARRRPPRDPRSRPPGRSRAPRRGPWRGSPAGDLHAEPPQPRRHRSDGARRAGGRGGDTS